MFFAIPFPIAFPPTVRDATIALIINCMLNSNPIFSVIFKAIIALIAPLNTPHISPITSAHIFATLLEFLISFKEVFAPTIFLLACAWNPSSLATVTATPIISNTIPIKITITRIINAGNISKSAIALVDMNENSIDNINVVTNITINHDTSVFS